MTSLEGQILGLLAIYGYAIVFGIVLVGALGVPLPSSVVLLAAGAFAVDGDLNVLLVIATTTAAAVVGDCVIYLVARRAGEATVNRFGKRAGITPERIETTRQRVGAWMGVAVFMTRWLMTPLAIPLDLLAGFGKYPLPVFALLSFTGELLWAALYVSAGYVFGASWSNIAEFLGDGSQLIGGAVLLVVGLLVVVKVARSRGRSLLPDV